MALGGLGSALGSAVSPGSNIGDIFKSGVKGASMTGLGMAGKSALSGLMERGGAEAGAELAGDAAGESIDDMLARGAPEVGLTPSAPSAMEAIGSAGSAAAPSASSPGFFSRVGNFIEKRPTASAMALKGVGDLATAPSENRFRDAQARQLDLETQMQQDELERRRRLEASLEPIRIMLAQQLNAPRSPVASNPYANG